MLDPETLEQHVEAGTLVPKRIGESTTRTYPRMDEFERNWDTILPANEAYEYDQWRTALAGGKSGGKTKDQKSQAGKEKGSEEALPTEGEIFAPRVPHRPGSEAGFSGWQTHTGQAPKSIV